jgi:hypothetical protein
MVTTWYNKVLWLPVPYESATGGRAGLGDGQVIGRKPWGSYAADF